MQVPPTMHVRSLPGRKLAGRLPSCSQVLPKSALWAAHVEVPSLTTAVQSDLLAQVTLDTTSAFLGDGAGDQVAPASLVATTTPLPGSDAPLEPTAMQSAAVGQETALSCGVLPPATCCAFHDTPPLVVAAMTEASDASTTSNSLALASSAVARTHESAVMPL